MESRSMLRLLTLAIASIGLLGSAGCSNENVERLGGGGEGMEWPEHDALYTPELFGGIEVGIGYGDVPAAMQHASSAEFKAAVSAFNSSELPGSLSDRTEKFNELTAALDAMISAAEGGNAEEFQTAFETAKSANGELTESDTVTAEE